MFFQNYREEYRGARRYFRPIGCRRYGINLTNYNDLTWLDTGTEEEGTWPAAYHGTSGEDGVRGIATQGFRAGTRKKHEVGIYVTPRPWSAKYFAKVFPFEGRNYKAVFQL